MIKRLRIYQQIIIVLIIAVLIPSITIGFIITNVSQHTVRKELEYSALLLTEYVGDNIESYLSDTQEKLSQIAHALPYLNTDKKKYLNEIISDYGEFKEIEVIPSNKKIGTMIFEPESGDLKIYADINSSQALVGTLNIENLESVLRSKLKQEQREIYVLDTDNTLITSNTNKTNNDVELKDIIKQLPAWKTSDKTRVFGDIKNQPLAYYTIENPNWCVVVNTTKQITKNTINIARFRIILAISLSGLFILIVVSLYTIYLYTNMRQLIKGVTAISKGNYDRKIHLIKNIFTPHELVFFAKEFNFMAKKISQSYQELSEKNIELQRLDGFRTNLISTTSHEFRTPLTNIVGYSSRLLRQDIQIDEATRIKSLKIIKEQAQRLSRMVEDLLIIPDIESYSLQFNMAEENLAELLEAAIFQSNFKEKNIQLSVDENIKPIYVDKDRLMQVLVNLCDNAIKYNRNDEPILISAQNIEGKNVVKIFNSHEKIDSDKINKLFEKFVRLDTELTRTTRGTGLGLFIVKGIANAMNIDVRLESDEKGFTVTLIFNEPERKNALYR